MYSQLKIISLTIFVSDFCLRFLSPYINSSNTYNQPFSCTRIRDQTFHICMQTAKAVVRRRGLPKALLVGYVINTKIKLLVHFTFYKLQTTATINCTLTIKPLKPEDQWSCRRSPSWPSKAQNLKIYGKEMTLTFNTHIPS